MYWLKELRNVVENYKIKTKEKTMCNQRENLSTIVLCSLTIIMSIMTESSLLKTDSYTKGLTYLPEGFWNDWMKLLISTWVCKVKCLSLLEWFMKFLHLNFIVNIFHFEYVKLISFQCNFFYIFNYLKRVYLFLVW